VLIRAARRRPLGVAAALLAATAVATGLVAAFGSPGRATGEIFPPVAAAAPGSWHRLTLPGRAAVLSYPPSLHPVAGDRGTVTAAQLSPGGSYLLYLNATPRQGTENLRHWATFRLAFLRSDHAASAHRDASATGVAFRGGSGSCVIDDYATKAGGHHYKEIACLVQGRTAASVIVAAAPAARWVQAGPLLGRAVAAYQVR
jgi:hypothetical protein